MNIMICNAWGTSEFDIPGDEALSSRWAFHRGPSFALALAEMKLVVAVLCRTVLRQCGHPSRSWRLKQPLRGTAINKSMLWPCGITWQEKTLKHSEFGKNAQEYFFIAFSFFVKWTCEIFKGSGVWWNKITTASTCQDQKPDGRGCPAGGCNQSTRWCLKCVYDV